MDCLYKKRCSLPFLEIGENFKRFQYFDFETDFLANENLFQKTEVPFLVESTNIENASFPYTKLPYPKLMLRQIR